MSILCSMVGATFGVAAAAEVIRKKQSVIAIANAQIDTAQSYFGGSSAYFDGVQDRLHIATNDGIFFTGDFTIEMWMRSGNETGMLFGNVATNVSPAAGQVICYYSPSPQRLEIYFNGQTALTTNTTIAINTWYHIAMVRSGSTVKVYVNGTEQSSTKTVTGDIGTSTYPTWYIGGLTNDADCMLGHLDEIRFSKSARYTTGFTPSTTPFVNDDNTVLLIHADGTDGSTFFEDDNGVRASIRLTGLNSAALSTAQSKFGGSSLIGSTSTNQQIEIDNKALNDISGPFTIECWFRTTNLTMSNNVLFFSNQGDVGRRGIHITNQTIRYSISGTDVITTGNFITSGTWHHIALVRNSSNTTNLYIDGTSRGSYANDTVTINAGNSTRIFGLAGVFTPDGHLDEFRISKVARYTSNFTAPTAPFVNDADTTLLVHFDGTNGQTVFRDDNGLIPFSTRTAKTLTAQGNAQVDTAQYKYGSSALLCDGTGDYVLSPANSDYNFGTSSFTIEFWIRFNVAPTLYVPIALRPSGSILNGEWWCEITNAEKKMYWGFKNQAGTQYYVNLALAGTAFTTGVWYHIALVNNAGTAQMYVDGVATGTTTSLAGSFGNSTTDLWVGAGAGAYSLNGWMDEVRISNIARYTANFTPTGPFNSDSNTLLLMHMEGTDASTTFTDDVNGVRTQKGIVAIGNAQLDTAQSKFSGSSYLGDGTGDYLTVDNLSMANDFTFECWVRFNALPTSSNFMMLATGDGNRYIGLLNNAGTQRWESSVMTGSNQYVARYTPTITTGVWYHIALVKSGSTLTFYQDGTSVAGSTIAGSMTSTSTLFTSGTNILGAYTSANYSLNGWMDEMRISNSARYTANFTPATAPFQNDANTVLLLHFDGTDASTVFYDDNGRDTTPT